MRVMRLVCTAALCFATLSCSWVRPEPSTVAQGQYYASGNPAFDEFFIKLHRFQVELAAAPDAPRRARAELAGSVGLGADAADAELEARIREEAHKLAQDGVRLKLELPVGPAASESTDASVTLRTSKAPSGAGELFTNRVRGAATNLLRIQNRMRLGHKELEGLRVQGIELDGQIGAAFRKESPWKREEVRDNIADGQKLITLMIARADEIERESGSLLEAIVRAATTDERLGADTALPAAPPTAAEAGADERTDDKPKGARPIRKGGAKPASARPPPASKPKAPPSGKAEPTPPPKPAPAESAPREFEP